jgi:hypothetical protein
MRRFSELIALLVVASCGGRPAGRTGDSVSLERFATQAAIAIADPGVAIGVAADGTVLARLAGADTSYRLVDSTGRVIGTAAVPGVGGWLAGDDGLFYTLATGATGITTVSPDGSPGPAFRLDQPGVLRGVLRDSVDLVRPGPNGFALVRVALDGTGQRIIVPEGVPEVYQLLGSAVEIMGSGPGSPLPSVTTSADRVVFANGHSYRIRIFSATGTMIGEIARDLEPLLLTPRQVENEILQLKSSGQRLTDRYLELARKQLARQRRPFFSHLQGLRFDVAGRLWVVGFDGDSAFADVFSDTTFVRRFPLSCPGFDGQWDLKGQWLALACRGRDSTAANGEVVRYRVR